MTEPRTTPEQRAALRRQCNDCELITMLYRGDLKALLDDADALAGALAECESLRAEVAALRAQLPYRLEA